MVLKRGTMLVPSGAPHNPDQKHLHIVCTDTCPLGGNLIVPVSSFYDGCDDTCLLEVGDHPFIRHLSYVFYAKSRFVKGAGLDKAMKDGRVVAQPMLIQSIFERVEIGIQRSPDTPPKAKAYHTAQT